MKTDKNSLPAIKIDWRLYFREFCEQHGKYPLLIDGRLFFPDGWSYSASNYEGPEYPPSKVPDTLRRVLLAYWKRRKKIVNHEVSIVKDRIEDLRNLQSVKSLPLQQVVRYYDVEANKYITQRLGIDIESLHSRLAWLLKDYEECTKELERVSLATDDELLAQTSYPDGISDLGVRPNHGSKEVTQNGIDPAYNE